MILSMPKRQAHVHLVLRSNTEAVLPRRCYDQMPAVSLPQEGLDRHEEILCALMT